MRRENKDPGHLRDTAVAVGRKGDTLQSAKFVPPLSVEMEHMLANLISYIRSEGTCDPVETASAHYQSETIRPFKDGNGCMGRLLIVLSLYQDGVLRFPALYPSEYFNRNRSEYVDRLYDVSSKGDVEGWFEFFIGAMDAQVRNSMDLIYDLHQYRYGCVRCATERIA